MLHLSTLCENVFDGEKIIQQCLDKILAGLPDENVNIKAHYSFVIKNTDPKLASFDLDRLEVVSKARETVKSHSKDEGNLSPLINPLDDPDKQREMEEALRAAELAN